ncbi:hypothetical protein GCM10012289_33910 [Nonomuraea cavernae]|uniref:Uncharacterized protein n=1 Tax=Nonomuraea cavernae TaxID=2045107 RepID=A0A918DKT6_9ACTN|nr:hypothetical protein GCM10012289_33910 [Nonomuraea cavernae]
MTSHDSRERLPAALPGADDRDLGRPEIRGSGLGLNRTKGPDLDRKTEGRIGSFPAPGRSSLSVQARVNI